MLWSLTDYDRFDHTAAWFPFSSNTYKPTHCDILDVLTEIYT